MDAPQIPRNRTIKSVSRAQFEGMVDFFVMLANDPRYKDFVSMLFIDYKIYPDADAWSLHPEIAELTAPSVEFENTSTINEVKLEFTSEHVDPQVLEIGVRGFGQVKVKEVDVQHENSVSLWRRKPGEKEWQKVPSGSGNGAKMPVKPPVMQNPGGNT
jgi:hypothetical protein